MVHHCNLPVTGAVVQQAAAFAYNAMDNPANEPAVLAMLWYACLQVRQRCPNLLVQSNKGLQSGSRGDIMA